MNRAMYPPPGASVTDSTSEARASPAPTVPVLPEKRNEPRSMLASLRVRPQASVQEAQASVSVQTGPDHTLISVPNAVQMMLVFHLGQWRT